MSDQAMNLITVVVATVVILGIIIGLIFFIVIPNLDNVELNKRVEFACTTYQGKIGCEGTACRSTYTPTACESLLRSVKYTIDDGKVSLFETCNGIGITDPRDCHVRCCGLQIGGKSGQCKEGGICDPGLTCENSKCVPS